jgi:hypothetical protein
MCPHTTTYVRAQLAVYDETIDPHTAIYVSSYCYICVLILLYMSSYCYVCAQLAVYDETIEVANILKEMLMDIKTRRDVIDRFGIQLYICPHTTIYVSSYCYISVRMLLYMCPHTAIYLSACYYICVLTLLYVCPLTNMYVSSYCCICVLILLYYICVLIPLYICPHTTIYVSSYYYICVLILLHMCRHLCSY